MRSVISWGVACALFFVQAVACFGANISGDEKKQLDDLFTPLAEANIQSFTQHSLTDLMMTDFAQLFLVCHEAKSLHKKNSVTTVIPSAQVDGVTERFFGRKVSGHASAEYETSPCSNDVELFSQVDELIALGDDRFEARGTSYYVKGDTKLDRHASPDTWKKKGLKIGTSATFTAVLKPAAEKGQYVIMEYTLSLR
ncbi:MAG: hypothetical protein FD177_808 [Desulfovibrionaceae bacterium]|nr:MAG: hypothetical protein FD177_808 [Desulfovibrionaceae bacterium]